MTNKEKITKEQKNKEHIFMEMFMISLLIVSFLCLILFSKKSFKDGAKEYFAVKYLENKDKLMFKNKDRDKYCSYKLDKNGNIKVKVKFDKLYKDEYANRIDLCVKFKPNSDRYKMDLTDYPGKIYSYHTMLTKANEFYITIYGIDYNPTEQEKLKAGTYTINVTGDVEIEDVAISKIETSFGSMYDTGFFDVLMHSGIYTTVVTAKDNHYIDCKKGTPANKWIIPLIRESHQLTKKRDHPIVRMTSFLITDILYFVDLIFYVQYAFLGYNLPNIPKFFFLSLLHDQNQAHQ